MTNGEPESRSWWRTLPGMLTAIATVITALAGAIVTMHQAGLFTKEPPRATAPPVSPADHSDRAIPTSAGAGPPGPGTASYAASPSTDRDQPTPLKSHEVRGKGSRTGKLLRYYYLFRGGPGEVTITLDFTSGGTAQGANVNLSGADAEPIGKTVTVGYLNREENRRVLRRIQLERQEPVTMQIELDNKFGGEPGAYLIRVEGAVQFQ